MMRKNKKIQKTLYKVKIKCYYTLHVMQKSITKCIFERIKWKHFKVVAYNITELKRQKTAILKK